MITAYAVVLAGGQGTRLWPLSRRALPKQFLPLAGGGQSLLQAAVSRGVALTGSLQRVLVVAPQAQAGLIRTQLPELAPDNLILEPVGRNTAAAIGLAALHLQARDPQAVMAVFPADHLFRELQPWLDVMRAALLQAGQAPQLVTVGLQPTFASPSYGYLHLGERRPPAAGYPVYQVQRFVEKPALAQAQAYLESGAYLWNTGTFAWQVGTILAQFERHLPGHAAGLQRILANLADWDTLKDVYQDFENISIDYGIMEKADQVIVVAGCFERIDLGNLANLADILPQDEHQNAGFGSPLVLDGSHNLVYDDSRVGLTVLLGVDDLVVVRQADVLLVCPRSAVHRIPELLGVLREQGKQRYL